MAFRLALATLVLLVGGCRNQPAQLDPFLGRTTVPAPPTGAVGAQPPGVMAYPAAPPSFTSPPTGTTTVPSTVPGTFVPNSSMPAPRPLSSTSPPANNLPSSPPTNFNVSTPMRVVAPDPNRRLVAGPSTSGGVDIMDLPVRGKSSQNKTAVGAARGALQSYEAPSGATYNVENAVAQVVTLPGQNPAYGFDETYSRLNGRLEYSPADGRWLLRYVAPEKQPDRFGGLVALTPMGSMNGFRSGDFVTADGRIDATGAAAPIFTATNVTLQREAR